MSIPQTTQQTIDSSSISQNVDWQSKYRGLKRKYQELFETSFKLSEDLHEVSTEAKKLRKEKAFLVDTIMRMEAAEEKSKPKRGRPPGSSKASQIASLLNTGDEEVKPLEQPDLVVEVAREKEETQTSENFSICAAVLGPGRPCKGKCVANSIYCWRHYPFDPKSDTMFCRYIDPNSRKKCSNPIPKDKQPALCTIHSSKASIFEDDPWVMNKPGAVPPPGHDLPPMFD